MTTLLSLMEFGEIKELSKMSHKRYQELEPLLNKPFLLLTVQDFLTVAGTSIFDHNFTDVLFADLFKRWLNHKG